MNNVAIPQGFDPNTFTTIPTHQKIEKPWGYEIKFTSDKSPTTGKILHVTAGKRLSLQYHDVKIETMMLYSGEANMVLMDQTGALQEIPMIPLHGYATVPGQVHRIVAVTDCDVFETSTPELGNTFRLQDDNARQTETEAMRSQKNRGWVG